MTGACRDVERVKVTVLTEGTPHPTLKGSSAPGNLRPLVGLSLFVEVQGVESCRILMDTGTFWKKLRHNAKALGKDLLSIDCGFITHWHFDHTGAHLHFHFPIPAQGWAASSDNGCTNKGWWMRAADTI